MWCWRSISYFLLFASLPYMSVILWGVLAVVFILLVLFT